MASFISLTERVHQCFHLEISKGEVPCAVFEGGYVHTEEEAGEPQLGQRMDQSGEQPAHEESGAGVATSRGHRLEASCAPGSRVSWLAFPVAFAVELVDGRQILRLTSL